MGSTFNDFMARFGTPHLMHHFSNRDSDNAPILLSVYLTGQEEARDVEAFIQTQDAASEYRQQGELETVVKAHRVHVLMRNKDTSGVDIALDTESFVVVPDGSTVASGRWGIERFENADGELVSVVLLRDRAKRYHARGYEQ